ncbi:MAG TPA: SdpI family protein [Candidatus Agathobaculum pullicola]|nr:SdpI family protein [Candidatus Agathobaculum pullicola]
MKKIGKGQVTVWILAVLPLVLAAAVYAHLPAEIPMQWDFRGGVEYEPKWHLWIVACLGPLLAVLFYFMPRFDPKTRNYTKFFGSYLGFQVVMMLFVLVMNGICVVEGLRPGTVDVAMVVCLVVSLMMVYLGNVMPKFRMNWFCGIKTPWTMSSETVWSRTHRVAGRMYFAAGMLGVIGAFFPNNIVRFVMLVVPLLTASLVATVLSYLWYRAEQRTC